MAGLGSALGYMAAGAAQGFGEGMAEKAEADRRDALEEARARREEIMLQRRQAFEAEQNQIQRDFTLERDAAEREHDLVLEGRRDSRAAAGRGPRDKYAETFVGTDGKMYGRTHQGTVEPLTDADGNPAPARRGGGDSDEVSARQDRQYVRERVADLMKGDPLTGEPGMSREDATRQAWEEVDGSYGRLPASSAPSEPAAAPAVKGDTPPAGAQKPRNFPDAVWSDRAGAWIVQRDGKWRPVTDVKG